MFQKETHQKSVIFVNVGVLKIFFLSVNHIFAMFCHDLMQKAIDFVDVTIASVKRSDYRSHFWYISKDDAII